MKYWRINNKLICGKNFDEAVKFADYLRHLEDGDYGDNLLDYTELFREDDPSVRETSLCEEIRTYLMEDAFEHDCIEWWNDYCDHNRYYEDRIEVYGNAREYAERMYCDPESILDELDRLYSDDTPYYGEYFKGDSGHGATVGYFNAVWDDYMYRDLADWFADGNGEPNNDIEALIDEFNEVTKTFEEEEDGFRAFMEVEEQK